MSEQYVEMAYARVSTKGQSLERQESSILEAVPDLKLQYFFEDKYTGKDFDREQYQNLKNKINELLDANSNTKIRVTIHELDRLGRDYKEIQNEVFWFRSKGVKLRFLDIPEELCNETMGLAGDMLVDIVIILKSFWAEQELHVKEKRTKEGIERAHANGVKFGRKEIVIDKKRFKTVADKAVNHSISHADAMKILNMKPYLYWKHIKLLYPDYQGKHVGINKKMEIQNNDKGTNN